MSLPVAYQTLCQLSSCYKLVPVHPVLYFHFTLCSSELPTIEISIVASVDSSSMSVDQDVSFSSAKGTSGCSSIDHSKSSSRTRRIRIVGLLSSQDRQAGRQVGTVVRLPDEGDFSVVASTSQTKGARADSRPATLRHKSFPTLVSFPAKGIYGLSYPESPNNTARSAETSSTGQTLGPEASLQPNCWGSPPSRLKLCNRCSP